MDLSLTGKVAIVTGASSGIGLAAARTLANLGAKVVITGRGKGALDEAASLIGLTCTPFVADVAKLADMEALYAMIAERYGQLDIIVANAGAWGDAPLGKITEEQIDHLIGTNLKGMVFTVQPALAMLKTGASVIVVGSNASAHPPAHMSIYSAAKAGMRALMESWVKDTKGSGVRFNVLSPGAVDTPLLRTALDVEEDEANIRLLEGLSPLGRIGKPEEIGNVIAFLASNASSYIHGVELFVDGGMKS